MSNVSRLRSESWLQALVDMINSITSPGDKITMVEVGSYAGESCGGFLSSGRIGHIYCVDPWKAGYDEGDGASDSDFAAVEAAFDERHGNDPRVTKVKGTIETFAELLNTGKLGEIKVDLVYIDANHTHDAVVSDITVAMEKIKPRLAISGHDYNWPGVKSGVIQLLGDAHMTFADNSWVIRTDGRRLVPQGVTKNSTAVVWASDGNDWKYLKYSVASMRMKIKTPCDFIILAEKDADLHDIDRTYGMIRIDPTPYMETLGISKARYESLHKSWPFPALFRLAIPLISRFNCYTNTLYLDSDTFAVPDCKRSPDELLKYPMGEFEVAGAPDLYVDPSRNKTLIRDAVPEHLRSELEERVWRKFGNESKTFVNDGVLLWNVHAIDLFWYLKRCRTFCDMMDRLTFPDNDFVNCMMGIDDSLSTIFNSGFIGGGPYATGKACIRHYTAGGKTSMISTGRRTPDITQDARFEQYPSLPRSGSRPFNKNGKKCIVWCCNGKIDNIRRIAYAVKQVQDVCRARLSGIDLIVLHDGPTAPKSIADLGVDFVDISGVIDASGFRTLSHDNWRGGWIYWDTSLVNRVLVPFVDELKGYDSVLYMESGTFPIDPKFMDLFDLDIGGYDCAMAGDFSNTYAIYTEHSSVGFCKWFVREARETPDANYILGRLNAGIYFNSDVFVCNMSEMRKTLVGATAVRDMVYALMDKGSPSVEHDIFNCSCRILRFTGAYNSNGDTHYPGDPVYCISDKSSGERYPVLTRKHFI